MYRARSRRDAGDHGSNRCDSEWILLDGLIHADRPDFNQRIFMIVTAIACFTTQPFLTVHVGVPAPLPGPADWGRPALAGTRMSHRAAGPRGGQTLASRIAALNTA